MNINRLRPDRKGWKKFDLNIGGFTIKGCKWHSERRSIWFPARYSSDRKRYGVIWTNGERVKKLRALLESGKRRSPKDTNASPVMIRPSRWIESRTWDGAWVQRAWLVFSFSLNGFRVVNVWWEPQSDQIKMPITYLPTGHMYRDHYFQHRRQVVTATKAGKQLLIEALEAQFPDRIANRAASHGQEEMQCPPPQMVL